MEAQPAGRSGDCGQQKPGRGPTGVRGLRGAPQPPLPAPLLVNPDLGVSVLPTLLRPAPAFGVAWRLPSPASDPLWPSASPEAASVSTPSVRLLLSRRPPARKGWQGAAQGRTVEAWEGRQGEHSVEASPRTAPSTRRSGAGPRPPHPLPRPTIPAPTQTVHLQTPPPGQLPHQRYHASPSPPPKIITTPVLCERRRLSIRPAGFRSLTALGGPCAWGL